MVLVDDTRPRVVDQMGWRGQALGGVGVMLEANQVSKAVETGL